MLLLLGEVVFWLTGELMPWLGAEVVLGGMVDNAVTFALLCGTLEEAVKLALSVGAPDGMVKFVGKPDEPVVLVPLGAELTHRPFQAPCQPQAVDSTPVTVDINSQEPFFKLIPRH